MVHANARLTQHGRVLLVRRVRVHGRPVAHVAKELGISRQCADGLTVSAMLRQAKQEFGTSEDGRHRTGVEPGRRGTVATTGGPPARC